MSDINRKLTPLSNHIKSHAIMIQMRTFIVAVKIIIQTSEFQENAKLFCNRAYNKYD